MQKSNIDAFLIGTNFFESTYLILNFQT